MDEAILSHPDCKITLYALSLIKTSITFWERPEVRKEIRSYFSNDENSWKPATWHKITQKVLNLAEKSDMVPSTVLPELKDAILNTGVKIFDWTWFLLSELGLDISHTEQICWTPLGFVDGAKTFKSFWENDSVLYEGDKPIFRLACIFTQEDFIAKHQAEMIEKLKNWLPKAANARNKLANYSDKIYGIISLYSSCYIYQDLRKERKENYFCKPRNVPLSMKDFRRAENAQIDKFDEGNILRRQLLRTVSDGIIPPPHIMAKLCVLSGLTHCFRYFYEKLNSSEKRSAEIKIRNYCESKLSIMNHYHYAAGKFREIVAFIDYSDEESPSHLLLLYLCPLESVIRPRFDKWLKEEGVNGTDLKSFLGPDYMKIIHNEYDSGLPVKRNLFQKLLKFL